MRENLKHHYALGRQFNSPAERETFVERFEGARERAYELGRQFVVAPDQTFKTIDGRILHEGEEVRATDYPFIRRHDEGSTIYESPPWRELEKAVLAGRVIDSGYRAPEPPRAA